DTTRIPPDFKEFLKLLIAHEVRFLLVGGYAVNAFGYSRNTADIDIWIATGAQNEESVIEAVRQFGFPSATSELLREPDAMLRMGVPPLRIKVLKKVSGIDFEDYWPRRVSLQAGDLEIPMISREDLKRNKRAAGRPKDLVDVEELS
ncbi:MAG: hypothetical protein B7X34_06445, partial [Acidobacteriia bacterium 12-62-4]